MYLASIIESRKGALSPSKYSEYTEIKFGAIGSYMNSSQYPDTFTGGSGDYQNSVLDSVTDDISATTFGGFLCAGIRSRNFDTVIEFGFSSIINNLGIMGRIKFPVTDSFSLSTGCTFFTNMNDSEDVEYDYNDPVSFLREMTAPTIGLTLEKPSLLFILDGSPVAFGAADMFYTSSPSDTWTVSLYLQSLMGIYIRTRLDYYINARFGFSLDARYVYFYKMLDTTAEDAGIPVFEHHNTLFITISPVFRF